MRQGAGDGAKQRVIVVGDHGYLPMGLPFEQAGIEFLRVQGGQEVDMGDDVLGGGGRRVLARQHLQMAADFGLGYPLGDVLDELVFEAPGFQDGLERTLHFGQGELVEPP